MTKPFLSLFEHILTIVSLLPKPNCQKAEIKSQNVGRRRLSLTLNLNLYLSLLH